jgi:hypothetical protein
MAFPGQRVGNEVIPAKSWIEPRFLLSDAHRFLQKTLEFIG